MIQKTTAFRCHICQKKSDEINIIYCLTCNKGICEESWKYHEHSVYLFDNGVLYCKKCDTALFAYQLEDPTLRNWIHQIRKLYNCNIEGQIRKIQQPISFLSDNDEERYWYQQILLNKQNNTQQYQEEINIQTNKNSVLKTVESSTKSESNDEPQEAQTIEDDINKRQTILSYGTGQLLSSVALSNHNEIINQFDNFDDDFLQQYNQIQYKDCLASQIIDITKYGMQCYKYTTKGKKHKKFISIRSLQQDSQFFQAIQQADKNELNEMLQNMDQQYINQLQIVWSDSEQFNKENKINMADVTQFYQGKVTEVFKKYDTGNTLWNKQKESQSNQMLCCSLATSERTLDLEFFNYNDYETFSYVIQYLLSQKQQIIMGKQYQ